MRLHARGPTGPLCGTRGGVVAQAGQVVDCKKCLRITPVLSPERRVLGKAHVTGIKSWLTCRLRWWFTAEKPMGLYLEPLVKAPALVFGGLVHEALQAYYDEGEPPWLHFRFAAEEELTRMQQHREAYGDEVSKFEDQVSLGEKVLQGYVQWIWRRDQKLKVLATETKGEIEVDGYPITFRLDGVVQELDTGAVWVLEFKTTSGTDARWTDNDLQATIYTMGARQMYGPDVQGVLYRFLRKKAPYTPEQLFIRGGQDVTDRQDINNFTTKENYLAALAVLAYREWSPGASVSDGLFILGEAGGTPTPGTEWETYYNMARKAHWNTLQLFEGVQSSFFWEQIERRTERELAFTEEYILKPALRQMNEPGRWIAPTGIGNNWAACRGCAFYDPCRMLMSGGPWRQHLQQFYQERQAPPSETEVEA